MEGNMDSAKASGNQLLKLISQRIDQRRRQEQAEEASVAPEVFEVPSTLEPAEISTIVSASTLESVAESEFAAVLPVDIDPVSTLDATPVPELDSDRIPAFVREICPEPPYD